LLKPLHRIDHLFSLAGMRNLEAIREMVQTAIARFGLIDVLVNNAGIQHMAPHSLCSR
jgi:3-hydroxybutyrate dehydrogenase